MGFYTVYSLLMKIIMHLLQNLYCLVDLRSQELAEQLYKPSALEFTFSIVICIMMMHVCVVELVNRAEMTYIC